MLKKVALNILSVAAILVVVSPGLSSAQDSTRVITSGSSTVAPLVTELGRVFEQSHPKMRVEVETGGSSRGVADAIKGVVDFGMASRTLKPAEENEGLRAVTVAWDGIAIILNKNNPVNQLSVNQIKAIYTGRITNWSELGGKDSPIVVVNKAQGRSTLELFLEHFKLKAEDIKASSIIGDNQQGVKLISSNPNAIGYVSIGTAEFEEQNGADLKLLPLEGVKASTANVKNGSYPLRRPLNLVLKGSPSSAAQEFIDFAASARANSIIEELYFVPINGRQDILPFGSWISTSLTGRGTWDRCLLIRNVPTCSA